jgi:hypothetical protein
MLEIAHIVKESKNSIWMIELDLIIIGFTRWHNELGYSTERSEMNVICDRTMYIFSFTNKTIEQVVTSTTGKETAQTNVC